MSAKTKYTNEPLGDYRVVPDFLPSPNELAFRDEGVKVTIALSKRSVEFSLNQGVQRGQGRKLLGDPATASWKDFTETHGMVVGGSPQTVADQLEEGVRDLRIGHLMVILQIQSMDRELTDYNMRLFAGNVLPRLRGLWERKGYQDHWWPTGATRNDDTLIAKQTPAKVLAR